MRKIFAVAVAALAIMGVAGCSQQVSKSDVEKQIGEQIEKSLGSKPESVTCPGGLDAKVGAEMTCTVKQGGMEFDVKAKVTKVENKTAYYDIEVVGEPRKAS